MFRLEIKRLLKTRSVVALAALALAASAFFAASTVFDDGMSVESRFYYDPSLQGLNAIEYLKGIYDDVEGYVTEERIDEVNRVSNEIWETYRSFDAMPREAFDQYMACQAILSRIGHQGSEYYEQRRENIESGLFTQNEAAARAATELDSSVDKPFTGSTASARAISGKTGQSACSRSASFAPSLPHPYFLRATPSARTAYSAAPNTGAESWRGRGCSRCTPFVRRCI